MTILWARDRATIKLACAASDDKRAPGPRAVIAIIEAMPYEKGVALMERIREALDRGDDVAALFAETAGKETTGP